MRQGLLLFLIMLFPTLAWSQNQPPVADAGPDQSIYTGDYTYVNGSATDPDGDAIIIWNWAVMDAPVGSEWNWFDSDKPTLRFVAATAGDYVLGLVVVDAASNFSVPDTVTVHVADNLPPVAVVTADPTSGAAPLTVCFDGSGSYDPEGGALIYDWDLDDAGAGASTPAVCHTYITPGSYNVLFVVGDVRNAFDSDELVITALAPGNQAPVASPTATPNTGAAPLFVQFSSNATDADGDALSYAWSFGDGATSTAENPAHTFAAGTYAVLLTVSDGTNSVSVPLTIVASPSMEFNVTRAEVWFKGNQSVLADVELQAELAASLPAPDDFIALYLDDAEVFAVPFANFEPLKEHGRVVPDAYKLKAKQLWVVINFATGTLAVDAAKVALLGYDPQNGVDVTFILDDAVAVDNIQPEERQAGPQ